VLFVELCNCGAIIGKEKHILFVNC